MNRKLILIVEDNEFAGKNLAEAFEDRGFRAFHALSREDAIVFLDAEEKPPDVVVLDMKLADGQTGADVGMSLRSRYRTDSPEFVIYSAFDDSSYYQAAIGLEAAVYIRKAENDYRAVVTHTRVLAVRRAIRNRVQAIHVLVGKCATVPEAILAAAREILAPELHQCLGTGFFVLFSDGQGHHCAASSLPLPDRHPAYAVIQMAASKIDRPGYLDLERHELSLGDLEDEDRRKAATLLEKLRKSVVLSLYHGNDIQLSLGIEDGADTPGSLQEMARPLAVAISRYFRSIAIEDLFAMTHVLAEEKLRTRQQELHKMEQERMREKELRLREQLAASARFCFSVGRMHNELYGEAEHQGEVLPGAVVLPKYKKLGKELSIVGKQLEAIQEEEVRLVPIPMAAIVTGVWDDLVENRNVPGEMLEVRGLCRVLGHRASLILAVKRILGWMAGRIGRYEPGVTPKITVAHEPDPFGFKISFRDRSRRMPNELLNSLFQPFPPNQQNKGIEAWLGLYTAKILVEIPNGGQLRARPWRLGDGPGHLLEMYLQAAQPHSDESDLRPAHFSNIKAKTG